MHSARLLLVLVPLCASACGDESLAPQTGQASVLVYNPGDAIARVAARPAVGDTFRATTLGDVAAIASACFIVPAGPHIFLEASVGSYLIRSNPIRFAPDERRSWVVGDPDIAPGGPCLTTGGPP
jgi:hypothetical protein